MLNSRMEMTEDLLENDQQRLSNLKKSEKRLKKNE